MSRRHLKIVFNAFPTHCQGGGAVIKMHKVKAFLEARGHEVDFFDPWSTELRDYDLYHHFSAMKWDRPLLHFAKACGLKVVLETMYWGSMRHALTAPAGDLPRRAKRVIEHLIKCAAPRISPNRRTLMMADALTPNSATEARLLHRHFAVPMERIKVVYNGVDPMFAGATPDLFIEKYGLRDFVLCTGIVEERKNQLSLIRSLKDSHLNLVIIGGAPGPHQSYLRQCQEEAGEDVLFVDALEHDDPLLASAYAACDTLALPSWHETTGKSCLEAAILGKNVVMTTYAPAAREYFGDHIDYVDPGNVAALRRALESAVSKPMNRTLRERIETKFTWDSVSRTREDLYLSLCA